jgi:hypothetical protein
MTYDPVGRAVWLDPAYGDGDPVQQVCELHASRLTAPLGWTVTDRRPAAVIDDGLPTRGPAPTPSQPVVSGLSAPAPVQVPEPEPAVPEPAVQVAAASESMQRPGGSGLLKRAFDWTGPQHSVLTSPASSDEESADEDREA